MRYMLARLHVWEYFLLGSIITFLHRLAGLLGTPALAPGCRSALARSGTACQARLCTAAWGCSCSFHEKLWNIASWGYSGIVVLEQGSISDYLCSGIPVSEPVLECFCKFALEYSCTSAWELCCTALWPPGCTVSWGWSGTAVLAQLSTAWSEHSDSLLSGLVLGHFCRFLWGHFGILVWEQPCILAWKLVLVHSDIAVLEHLSIAVLEHCYTALLEHFCILVLELVCKLGLLQHHIRFLLRLHDHLHGLQIHHHS